MNRGSIGRGVGAAAPDTGFNEAPIHESGKCATRIAKGLEKALLQ